MIGVGGDGGRVLPGERTQAPGPRVPRPRAAVPVRRAPVSSLRERAVLAGLCAGAVLVALGAMAAPGWVSVAGLLALAGLGGILLRTWYLLIDVFVLGAVVFALVDLGDSHVPVAWTAALSVAGAVLLTVAQSRDRSGVSRAIGDRAAADAVLIDLRDRVSLHGRAPALPPGWELDSCLHSAYGDSFSGDFMVFARPEPQRLEVALVDVSGKGRAAGSRALQLTGAFGALLEELPGPAFLPAANRYLARRGDDEHFATAVHVSLDLCSGEYVVRGAGHPPAVHFRAGSGRWHTLDRDQGPALGILDDAMFPRIPGVLARGDALLLFTDGLVEARGLDVAQGIDRLIGRADPVLARGVARGAATIAAGLRAGGDDQALVLLRRT